MKILLTDWYTQWHGSTPQVLKPVELPLDDQKVLFGLVVFLGNGEYDEACIESDSRESRECITGLLCGSGGAKRVEPSAVSEQCRLHRAGYEIYLQGSRSYFFVNPIPRPELFGRYRLDDYLAEFKPA